jgi:hypothetical protein
MPVTAAVLRDNTRPRKPKTHPSEPPKPLRKKPLPAGLPREWYISHNRRLKAMRLAIALMDTGVYVPEKATNRKIRAMAARLGIHPPSATTCRLVRTLIREELGR